MSPAIQNTTSGNPSAGGDRGKATIYDVAERAGVAISTVSRVLNDSNDVSEQTRERVSKAIEELQFRPDRTAKTLAKKHTRSLAIAIPTFTTPFHNELLKGVRMRLREYDVDLLLCDLGSTAPHKTLMNFLKRGTVDGLLLAGLPLDERVAQELKALHSPVVLIGYQWPDFDSYYWDDVEGARTAVNHLIRHGHRRIGLIRTHSYSPLQDRRLQGYREALEAANIPYDPDLVQGGQTLKHAGFSEESGYEAMQQLLSLGDPATAVFASSDVQAIGAWKAIRDAGKQVPKDVALVGYDDIKTSHYIGLSSIDQSMHEVGEEATEMLIQRMQGDRTTPVVDKKIMPKLIIRESSQPTHA
ncbi:MAG TPA: LacI family DNA-binding transcriptional regulator [Rhodothermales bacterium]|nr:LacI family DNA-binding transcriptional regulator [Rhodothermales bacterium]